MKKNKKFPIFFHSDDVVMGLGDEIFFLNRTNEVFEHHLITFITNLNPWVKNLQICGAILSSLILFQNGQSLAPDRGTNYRKFTDMS